MKPVVSRIKAKSFRSLADVDVTLEPLTVLVGPNGSGKTNLLKVIQFIANSARYDVSSALDEWGGFEHVARMGSNSFDIEIEGHVTDFASESAPDSYRLKVTRRSDTQRIQRSEELQFKRVSGPGKRITVSEKSVTEDGRRKMQLADGLYSGLGTLARLSTEEYGPGPGAYLQFLTSILYLDPDVDAARRPARPARGELLEDAANLADVLQQLKTNPDVFSALLAEVQLCLPGLEDIVFTAVGGAGRAVEVSLIERGLPFPVPLVDASFGTVRVLALLAALHNPNPPRLTVIEELDHGLHPYALDVLVDRMRHASGRTQIIAATHSPTLVNRLTASEILICDRDSETGESEIPARDPHEIKAALEGSQFGLGELWFAGALGGVPD